MNIDFDPDINRTETLMQKNYQTAWNFPQISNAPAYHRLRNT